MGDNMFHTGSPHKLDLDSFWLVHLNHCAQIAATKAVFGHLHCNYFVGTLLHA